MQKDPAADIVFVIPLFFAAIIIEYFLSKKDKSSIYHFQDSLSDINCGVFQQISAAFFRPLMIFGYFYIYQHYRLNTFLQFTFWHWIILFFAVDFLYYWFHRLSHEVHFLWAIHSVHHQSEYFNLSVGLRQSALQPFFAYIFYLPLAFLGVPPLAFLLTEGINVLYQFWIHTSLISRVGFLESFLNTPSHHRVHHGINPQYIDRNHAGVFIIWDCFFKTFEPEKEKVIYGVTRKLNSFNPFWANLFGFYDLYHIAQSKKKLIDRFKTWFKDPGWDLPQSAQSNQSIGTIDVKLSLPKITYILLQFTILIIWSTYFLYAQRDMTFLQRLMHTFFLCLTIGTIYLMGHNRRRAFLLDSFRCIACITFLIVFRFL